MKPRPVAKRPSSCLHVCSTVRARGHTRTDGAVGGVREQERPGRGGGEEPRPGRGGYGKKRTEFLARTVVEVCEHWLPTRTVTRSVRLELVCTGVP